MEKCRRLEEYALFVAKVRMYMKDQTMSLKKAITVVMKECIEEGILEDILTKQRDEVFGVILSTFNKELYEKNLKQNAYEDGIQTGMKTSRVESVENIMKNLNVNVEEACRIIGITFEEYKQAKADTE